MEVIIKFTIIKTIINFLFLFREKYVVVDEVSKEKVLYKFLKIILGNYGFLHSLKHLYINRANKGVYLLNKDNQKKIIYKNSIFLSEPLKLTKETFDSLIDIMKSNKMNLSKI